LATAIVCLFEADADFRLVGIVDLKQEEISVQSEELETQIDELRLNNNEIQQANIQLRDSEENNGKIALELGEQLRILDYAHVLVRDTSDHIIRWNTGLQNLYGYTKEEAIGRVSHELFKTSFPVSKEDLAESLARTGHWQGELVHKTKSGQNIVVASHQVLYRDDCGNPRAVLEVNNDITGQKRLERQLSLKKNELEEQLRIVDLAHVLIHI